jgi:hypothetical protein
MNKKSRNQAWEKKIELNGGPYGPTTGSMSAIDVFNSWRAAQTAQPKDLCVANHFISLSFSIE